MNTGGMSERHGIYFTPPAIIEYLYGSPAYIALQAGISEKIASLLTPDLHNHLVNEWILGPAHFRKKIEKLMRRDEVIHSSFVVERDGKYYWQRFHGCIEYLGAFIYYAKKEGCL